MPDHSLWGASTFSRSRIIFASLALMAVIGILDLLTGYELSFAVFYLLPVGLAAWYANRVWGLVLALGASLVWYMAEIAAGYPYTHTAIPVWNAAVRLTFFVIVALLLSTLRSQLLAEIRSAMTDPLTGVANSRAFRERLEHDLSLMVRVGKPLSLVYIDLDDFKTVNDEFGHHVGDRLLTRVARALVDSVRTVDTVARLGGDEFALVLPAMDHSGADRFLAKLRETFAGLGESGQPVPCSIGAVVFDEHPGSPAEAVQAADQLMYTVKAAGKNSYAVECYPRRQPELGVA